MSETPKTDCSFCAIAAGAHDSVEVICEEASWLAFLPPSPATLGHTLIAPRQHVADLWVTEPRLAGELTAAVIRIGHAVERALEPEGMNLITSKGEAGEQSVFHLHLHLVPRWRDDALNIWPEKKALGREVRERLGEKIRGVLEDRG